ncbi:TetR/AcrR family transcriptional regulator [Actinoplanes friuliensis]|uniref:Transcriptional regulator, TetR family protein n=1 Tax=Actinoplanes friuliensis DSM 7358 TaxID=1246995 RepID=U5VVP3_9ACTN|nr:TetR/AcrR family transcriptional regulator [Actinoplanes friuliensis]AGZ40944.1 transcriptional regulator, TetR family protein [Actinoplanes friuliensis DSM 7358]
MDDESSRRQQILEVAAEILERDGIQAVSTRTVAAAAGIRAASLYQLFGDKDGLLDALAIQAFERYLAGKDSLERSADPLDDLRRGWDMHVEFGLRHPALYVLMFGTDRPGRQPPAAAEAHDRLLSFLVRVADAGRLTTPPAVAAQLVQAAATGITLSLIASPAGQRDPQVATKMRELMVASLTTDSPPPSDPGLATRALALDAALSGADDKALPLRASEVALLRDWLNDLAD